jgi:cytoskeletal protein CcmA (bactofilin family)
MFNKEKNGTTDRTNGNSATLISAGTTLSGDITSDNDLRIDGTIRGNVYSTAKIIIGASGFVEGNIDGLQADINGKVQGNITVKELLQLKGQCNVQGNIIAEKLQIEPTATFNGQCQMAGKSTATVQKKKNEQLAEVKAN